MGEKFAKILTLLFQPIFVPLYGFILLWNSSYFYAYSLLIKVMVLGLSSLFMVILPAIFYAILCKTGNITTPQATNSKERIPAYIITMSFYSMLIYILLYIGVVYYFNYIVLGALLALIIVFIVNFYWKISAHATGMGGLLGAVMYINWLQHQNFLWLYVAIILCGALVASARLQLKAHTSMQLLAGYSVGFACVGVLPWCVTMLFNVF
ncbi:MAG: hypothetical protein EOL95_00090 [Bacteroidia bacterium]|nr:hypothetical protein [Bacteroidia bacterium]